MTMFGSQWLANAGSGYEIDQSIRFDNVNGVDAGGAQMFRLALTGTPTNTKKATISAWVKRATLGFNQTIAYAGDPNGSTTESIRFDTADTLSFQQGSSDYVLTTTQVFRDIGAWYHIVAEIDTANGTAADRANLYVNGTKVTSFSTENYPTQDYVTNWTASSSSIAHTWGTNGIPSAGPSSQLFAGYMAEMFVLDGEKAGASSFGETNDDGVWIPTAYSGSFGNNGYYMTGGNASALGEDFSGNNLDFTTVALAATDQVTDTPTDNFCVLSPIDCNSNFTLSDGNLTNSNGTNAHAACFGTIAFDSADTDGFYWEVDCDSFASTGFAVLIADEAVNQTDITTDPTTQPAEGNLWAYRRYKDASNGGITGVGSTGSFSDYGPAAVNGNVVGFCVKNGKLFIAINNTWLESSNPATEANPAFSNLTGNLRVGVNRFGDTGTDVTTLNFGQTGFTYTPPTGAKAISTANLATPTIKDGSAYFHPQLYTGNGSSGLAITNAANAGDFEADLLIIAPRSNGDNKVWFDDVRGTTNRIRSNSADPADVDGTAQLTFESDGFDLDTTDVNYNGSGRTYVAWQWKKGATPGFDIVQYTGNKTNRTISHSLGVAPEWIVIKDYTNTESWNVGHNSIGWTKNLFLNLTNGESTSSSVWQDTAPTSSVFTIGTSDGVNKVGSHIAYLWASVAGFSKFGSYTGNGNADGPFVYTGFKPRWVMIKSTGTESWPVLDTARGSGNFGSAAGANGNNPTAGNDMNAVLVMSTSSAEEDNASGSRRASYLSNGFKVRTTNSAMNSSGQKYVYMAFAEHPFGGDDAAPATAR